MLAKNRIVERRGVVLVFVAVCIVTLLFAAALAVDVGYICALTAEQQNNADAGALACAAALNEGRPSEAYQIGMDVISMNQVPQKYLSTNDQIIEIGKWDSITGLFTPTTDMDEAFACRVRAVRTAPLFFAAAMGKGSTTVWREAVATGSKPCMGIWGLEGIRVPGNVMVDSFDSTEGDYTASTAGDNGGLCSGHEVRVMGSAEINGDAMAGFGYPVDAGGRPDITGMTTSSLANVTAPVIDFGDIATNNDNHLIGKTARGKSPFSSGNNVRIGSQDSLTLPAGRFYFGSLTLNAQSSITFSGDTTIYMTNNLDASGGGLMNKTEDPAMLSIFSTGTSVKLSGDYTFYGTIVAPYANVDIGGDLDYYGALVGLTLNIHGSVQIHVDESLEYVRSWIPTPPPGLVR